LKKASKLFATDIAKAAGKIKPVKSKKLKLKNKTSKKKETQPTAE